MLKLIQIYAPGQHEVVDELLRNEADTKIPDDNEKTLLEFAKQQSNDETIELLTKYEIKSNLYFYIFNTNER